jgi:2-polyprenyl-3-methyl-5-hydroxy-6-metoxy-1,4-benzoquinol methylase
MIVPRSGRVRSILKRVPGLTSAFYFLSALRQSRQDEWRHPSSFDAIFSTDPDPWRSSSESERRRFELTLSLLDRAGLSHFDHAVEVGCGEGFFTVQLAPRCENLDALDYSAVALESARAKTSHRNVRFVKWDMRKEQLAGNYDLVVSMGVLTSLYRPADVKRVAEKLIDAMTADGHLLFSDVRQSRVFEDAWWGRVMLRGGEQIRRYLQRHSALETVELADTDTHVFALFRKRTARI